MKLLDKYLLRSLLRPLAYCLAAFVIIIIIHDLFDHLSDFLEGQASLADVLLYYVYLLPSVLILIMPVSLLLATLYSLLQLTKHNELTAMRASGVSLYRLMLPFILTGLSLTLVGTLVNETIGPRAAYYCAQYLQYLKHAESAHVALDLPFYNGPEHRDWFIGKFNTKTYEMENVQVVQESDEGGARTKIRARRGQWLDGHWWFSGVSIQEFDKNGNPVRQFDKNGKSTGVIRFERELELPEFSEKPRDIVNITKDPQYLTTIELWRFVRAQKLASASPQAVARVEVDMYSHLAMPWMTFIVMLLGVPFGSQTARKGAITGVLLSMGLFFGYYFFINMGLWLGKALYLPPWLAAWFPNLLFMAVGIVLLYRMR